MKKTIIIHVGPPKTGSSAIQKWLNENQTLLLEYGYLYPPHKMDKNGISSGNFTEVLDVNPDRKATFNRERFETLLSEFYKSEYHTLLLSSEYFINQVENFLKVVPDIIFVVYVRPPIEFVESIYNQSVKRNGNPDFIPLRKKVSSAMIDKIVALNNKFGSERFRFRAYSENATFYPSIIHDFCEAVGVDLAPTNIKTDERINNSYCFEALEFKRWLNRYVGKKFDPQLDPLMQKFTDGIDEFCLIPKDLFELYREQSIELIKDNFQEVSMANREQLITHIGSITRQRYCHQALNDKQFNKMVSYLIASDYKLYILLCREVMGVDAVDTDNYRYAQMFLQGFLPPKQLLNVPKIISGNHSLKSWLYTFYKSIFK